MAKQPTRGNAPLTPPVVEEEFKNPATAEQFDGRPAVKDKPYNPFDEPIADEYPDGTNAEVSRATLAPAETVVEHPLSPTDTNPNPHGNRDEAVTRVPVKDKDGNVTVSGPEEGDIEIEGTEDNPVHLGDGRTLGKGQRAKVSADLLKNDAMKGKYKRV